MQMEDAKLGKQIAALPCLLLPRYNLGLKRSCQDLGWTIMHHPWISIHMDWMCCNISRRLKFVFTEIYRGRCHKFLHLPN